MTLPQEQFADNYFEEYIARDFLGLAKKKEQEAEDRAKARARAARRRRELLGLIAAPCAVTHAFYKRKREEYRLYRKGKRTVTTSRRKRFVLFCAEKQVAHIRKYIKSGHPVNDTDSSGRTGMHHAAAAGHASVIRELLKRGGTVDPKEFTRNVTPFWYSALRGDLSSGEMLIDARCDVDACDAVNRHTPLMLCAIGNFLNFAERLLEEGAFLTMQDELGMTPLHHAAFHGHTSMVFLLLEADHEKGGARDMRDEAGNLPGMCVCVPSDVIGMCRSVIHRQHPHFLEHQRWSRPGCAAFFSGGVMRRRRPWHRIRDCSCCMVLLPSMFLFLCR